MRLMDVLAEVTRAIRNRQTSVQLGKSEYPLRRVPGDRWMVHLPKADLVIESSSPTERTLVGQATKNMDAVILRVRRGGILTLDGSVNGRYVPDVEHECTQMMFATTI